jgi:hypothetical protein
MKQGCLSIYRREPSFESDNDAAAFQVSMIRLCFYASLFGGSQLHSYPMILSLAEHSLDGLMRQACRVVGHPMGTHPQVYTDWR